MMILLSYIIYMFIPFIYKDLSQPKISAISHKKFQVICTRIYYKQINYNFTTLTHRYSLVTGQQGFDI